MKGLPTIPGVERSGFFRSWWIGMLLVLYLPAMSQPGKNQDTIMNEFHTAKVLDSSREDYIEVVFLESARFYKLPLKSKNHGTYLKLLRSAEKTGVPLTIRFTGRNCDIIQSVRRVYKTKRPGK